MRERLLQTMHIILTLIAFLIAPAGYAQDTPRSITDAGGQSVEVPHRILRVMAAGPPASILLYTLAPEKMIGWVRIPTPAEKAFLKESVRDCRSVAGLRAREAPPISRMFCDSNPISSSTWAVLVRPMSRWPTTCRSRRSPLCAP